MSKFQYWMAIVLSIIVVNSCKQVPVDRSVAVIDLKFDQDYTPTYDEIIDNYRKLDNYSDKATLMEVGETDAGKPLHLFVISADGDTDPVSNREKGRAVLFINNGIHPGEPCGIDASLKFADELLRNVDGLRQLLEKVTICIIPVYNVGGHLNRSAFNRANQVGPLETGFRGNARNLDLNRDFIKCDSKNAKSFNRVFTSWKPDVFLDTHTTNGSDHQYCITLIPTNTNALPAPMGHFLRSKMLQSLYSGMSQTPYEMTPYVAWVNQDPSQGVVMTLESGRFSTGYSRFNYVYGFMTENHVYKPFKDRVLSNYYFIRELATFTAVNATEIIQTRADALHEAIENDLYSLDYKVDTTQFEEITFKGYEAGMYESPVTGLMRFGYDRSRPYTKKIPYYTTYHAAETIEKPVYYILPGAWTEAVERMKLNNVEMEQFPKDMKMSVDAYYLTKVSHANQPYNGHYFHDSVDAVLKAVEVNIYAGDYLIPVNQEKMAYIIECLEPKASDSFFRWNFFDSMLDRREYFSPWGFEANAQKYLDEHPGFKEEWEQARKNNRLLKDNHYQQMAYIYGNSEWSEASYMRYPVFRLNNVELSWLKQ